MASHRSYKNQNSSYQGRFQGNVDQGKGNLDQASEELELSDRNSFGGREFLIVGEIFVDRTFFICENFFSSSIENLLNDPEFHHQSRIHFFYWSQNWSTVSFDAITQQTKYKGK